MLAIGKEIEEDPGDEEQATLIKPPPAGSLSARKRSSAMNLANRQGSFDDDHRLRYTSTASSTNSPLTSPTFQQTKTLPDSGSPVHRAIIADNRMLMEHPPIDIRPGVLNTKRSAESQRNRLIGFGTITIALSSLLWFSVYQRHTVLGSPDEEEESDRRPWVILGAILSFLEVASICAGVAIRKEEEQNRVRVVRGDSILGMIAEQDKSISIDCSEPTTPQRVWAMKAISEMDHL